MIFNLIFQLGRLLAFMLSNRQEVDQRIYALSYMMGEARGTEVLRLIISSPELVSERGSYTS